MCVSVCLSVLKELFGSPLQSLIGHESFIAIWWEGKLIFPRESALGKKYPKTVLFKVIKTQQMIMLNHLKICYQSTQKMNIRKIFTELLRFQNLGTIANLV